MAESVPSPTPLISVIVRSMDRPSLPAALESIAAQDAAPLEVVLVNARGPGHRPPSAAAGTRFVRWVDAGRPLRRSAAANAGLDAAIGERVIFLDDDDVFLPAHLSRLTLALDSEPDAVAAYADVDYGHDGPDGWISEHVFAADFDALRLRFENYLPLHAVLVDRHRGSVAACRFDETLDLFEDWDWWLQLSLLGRFVRVPGVSARYVRAATDGSGVFADSAAATQARERLLTKWLQRDSLPDRLALLQALQAEYRSAMQSREHLTLAQRTEQDLRFILAHREHDLTEAGVQLTDLRQVLACRERELADAIAQIDGLQAMLAARDREIADFQRQSGDLRRILAARDEEIGNLRAAPPSSQKP